MMRPVRRLRKCSKAVMNIWMRSSLSHVGRVPGELSINLRTSSKIKDSE